MVAVGEKGEANVQKENNDDEPKIETTEHGDTEGLFLLYQISRSIVANQDWHHASIFHTRVACFGLHYNLIIDSWNLRNLVSSKFTKRLKLTEAPLVRLYTTTWLSQEDRVTVHHRCLFLTLYWRSAWPAFLV